MASEFPNLKKALEDYIEDVKNHYKDTLTRDNKKATGKLINTVRANVKIGATQYTAELRLQDYWKYIEYGTKPHWPPSSAILKWIHAKPILPKAINGITPTETQLAYLIGRKISREGTKGGNYLQDSIDDINSWYKSKFEEALAKDIGDELAVIFNNF